MVWRQAGFLANLPTHATRASRSPRFRPCSLKYAKITPVLRAIGRKTLVAAGHMTTQNLGGKKICWMGGVAEYFVWLM